MKPLILLISVFVITLLAMKLFRKQLNLQQAGRIALSVMLLFTASGHFMFPESMAQMIPGFIPFRTELVYFTGVVEMAAAIGLQIPGLRVLTGWLLIVFFMLILPANIHAAIIGLDYQTGTLDGPGLSYLWFRIPLQLLFIAWTYLSTIASMQKTSQQKSMAI